MRSICLKTGLLALWLATASCCHTALAQVRYTLHRIPLESVAGSGNTIRNGMNNVGLAIGSHSPGGIKHGYVYDHYGLLGPEETLHTLTEWVEVPDGCNSSCIGLNDVGQVVGLFERTTSLGTERVGFLLDFHLFSDGPEPTWRLLPTVLGEGEISSYGRRINNDGVVLIESQTSGEQFVYDSSDPFAELIPLPVPADFYIGRFMGINDSRQLATANGDGRGIGVRLTLTPAPELEEQEMLEVPGVEECWSINEYGVLGLKLRATRDARGRIIMPVRAGRYSDTNGLEELSTIESHVWDINDSGDVCGYNGGVNKGAIYTDEGGWQYLDDVNVITGDQDDVDMWLAAGTRSIRYIANRDSTGSGNLYAIATRTIKSGKGKNAVTTTDVRDFLLVPQLNPVP